MQRSAESFAQARPLALIATLGVVYGDIGTSPLYVFRAVARANGGHFDQNAALGSLSLIFWTLIVVVATKYALIVMRASNRGEGGILALMALTRVSWRGRNRYLIICGLIGAALLYGDGIITPAISVLSAIEGLNGVSSSFAPFTMPLAAVILLALFLGQRFGTAAVGGVFGPLMLAWFVFIAALGVVGISKAPAVLAALNPSYLVDFLIHDRVAFLAILGAVFLCVTGAEAMYADMGQFGRSPIRFAWTVIVLPSLVLNYAGQTAVVLVNPGGVDNPFFSLASGWLLYPAIAISTLATVIASQAIITGSFSLTRQAIQLGWLPGMRVRQTSDEQVGQVYVPFVNWAMMLATLALTIGFASSDRLAGAYGAAVSTTMLMTTAILLLCRCDVFRGQSHEDPRRRLGPASGRRLDLRCHEHMARRHGCDAPSAGTRRDPDRTICPAAARSQNRAHSRQSHVSRPHDRLDPASGRRSPAANGFAL
jgi:KUP system potassium uptake protein